MDGFLMSDKRRNEYDVTDRIRTTQSTSVSDELLRIAKALYPNEEFGALVRAFNFTVELFHGRVAGYHACDTGYHNLQHTLEVTLAMARLMAGYVMQSRPHGKPLGGLSAKHFEFGCVCALFHDSGYFRKSNDRRALTGAVYTRVHVTRGAHLLRSKIVDFGLADFEAAVSPVLHFTGYERAVKTIRLKDPILRLIGSFLGTADILGQMADRCYLEKCQQYLFAEFEAGGVTRRLAADGKEIVVFESADDLLRKTPSFYKSALKRLDNDLGASHQYASEFFGGQNLYFDAITRNIEYAEHLKGCDRFELRRILSVPVSGK
jgi:hypothetical protein